jgi:hypothetical protein
MSLTLFYKGDKMKCENCGKEFSDKIYNIHIEQCKPNVEPVVEQPKNKGGRPRK